jgi:LPS O-antigen subunit length determinant protein (WzzB/FepE family)
MARCAGTTRDGRQCTAIVKPSQTYCYQHDPARSEERKRNAARAGRSKPNRELVEVKGRLRELAEDVLAGSVDRADAAVAGQLFGTFIRAVSAEIKVKEVLELEERIEQLEQATEVQKGGKRWGA